jgi:putative SOS response-associated peptidase YedK
MAAHLRSLAGIDRRFPLGPMCRTIITTDANDLMRPLHDRMPVILDPGDFDKWLDPTRHEPDQLQGLLCPFPSEKMKAFAIVRRKPGTIRTPQSRSLSVSLLPKK